MIPRRSCRTRRIIAQTIPNFNLVVSSKGAGTSIAVNSMQVSGQIIPVHPFPSLSLFPSAPETFFFAPYPMIGFALVNDIVHLGGEEGEALPPSLDHGSYFPSVLSIGPRERDRLSDL